ncbi:sensor histidine kinase [Tranquillimonas alkanivorans]|uniref:histidine kinase n=1 Tax=Tranquillimonas alkanivorans TaxID=441119 RepID=A0A1I5Q7S3_9RHOB|nr:HAMP domain-containing sensor histidine kinase [Tranquillimonas alkanivorans]SFP42269.1 Signal transduction histidine kinase [Tranquillimonas alkanivorans]
MTSQDIQTRRPGSSGVRAARSALHRSIRSVIRTTSLANVPTERLETQMRDFVSGGIALFWQRQGMYIGAGLLAAIYYDLTQAIICFLLLQLTDLADTILSKRVLKRVGGSRRMVRRYHNLLLLTSFLSSLAVAYFTLSVAALEGEGTHFAPLFFLFAAGLFAAVNNHQLPRVLLVRLVVYGAVFLYIPAADLIALRPPLSSPLWMGMFTVGFVLFFVIECSIIFLQMYRSNLDRIDELKRERDRATKAYEVKSQFVSVVSHELRTPLTSIIGSLSLLQSGLFTKQPERAESIVEIAYKNGRRLSDLINDLLDLQKIESGQMRYSFQCVDLNDLVEEAVRMMDGYADQADVRLDFEPASRELFVRADRGRLAQVVNNLLSNAVKFSHKGGTVRVAVHEADGRARVSVEDTGTGIPEDARERVFGKFSQVDSSDHRSYQGTGLGLNIAQQIMQAHDGTIDYESVYGDGTTFTLELDVAE